MVSRTTAEPSPCVSVLLPVRDAATTLDAALGSLVRQTLTEIEILAVEDGSRDASPRQLENWRRRDARVRVLLSGGAGLVPALELARRQARAPYLARMDADDLAHPERLQLQLAHLAPRPELAGTGCLVRLFPRHRLRDGWRRYEGWINSLVTPEQIRRERFVESPLVHPSMMLRAAAVDSVGGWRECGWPEDHDLWLRLLDAGWSLDKVPRRLLAWRDSPARHSRIHPRYAAARFDELKLEFLLAGPLAGCEDLAVWGAGRNGRRWGRMLRRCGRRVDCFLDIDPRKIGRKIGSAPVRPATDLGALSGLFVLGAVAAPGARELIREALTRSGRREERDFLFVQ